MDTHATAIVMAPSTSTENTAGTAMHGIADVISMCTDAKLDVVLVAPTTVLNAWQGWCQAAQLNVAALPSGSSQQFVSSALRVGVQMSAMSSGWILVPADMAMLKPCTLPTLSAELKRHLIVQATHRNQARLPVGFGQELFSELIHLDSDHALYRLMNRYPTQAVEVNEPGIPTSAWLPTDATLPRASSLLERHKDA